MRTGKLPENVWKRSVLKQLKTKREEVVVGAGIGEDCAILSFGDGLTALSSYVSHWPGSGTAAYALHGSVNALAAAGALPVAVDISAVLPLGTEEGAIKEMTAQAEAECALLGIQAAGCHIEVTGAVNVPMITVTGIGRLAENGRLSLKRIKPGQDIVASKWIGLEGTAFLAAYKEEELLKRYPSRFLSEAKRFGRFLSSVPEAATAIKSGVCAMHSAAGGGIFGALWELAEGAGVGLEVDLKRIPVKQETVEICDFFGINPYEAASGGCLLMVTDKGYDLVSELEKQQIHAMVIGKTTGNNDRVVINGEERRFLEMPKADDIGQVTEKNGECR